MHAWSGDTVCSGSSYKITKWHSPTTQQWHFPGFPLPDVALAETDSLFSDRVVDVATGPDLPQPDNIGSFWSDVVTVVGFSDNGTNNTQRLRTSMTIAAGATEQGYSVFSLSTGGTTNICAGDSGGPILRNGKIIGVVSSATIGCTTSESSYAGYLVPDLRQVTDTDGDGISNSADNCPNRNADQSNCDGAGGGDACDPHPCIYNLGVSSVPEKVTTEAYQKSAKLRVLYRGVGYTDAQPWLQRNVDAYFCACHKLSDDPHNPDMYLPEDCPLACPNASAYADPATKRGWWRIIWQKASDDTIDPPWWTNEKSCPLWTDDNDGVNNDCHDPAPNRLFRRPYADASGVGFSAADWESYWTDDYRTRDFVWDWRRQDYPHLQGQPYLPPIDQARLRLWLRPENDGGYYPSGYIDPFDVGSPIKVFDERLLTPLEAETSILPDPIDWVAPGPSDPPSLLLVRPLAVSRSDPGAAPYLWPQLPSDALTAGLLILRFNPDSGELDSLVPSQISVGDPVYTTDFAVARWPADELYVFGGVSASGALPAKLWWGVPVTIGPGIAAQAAPATQLHYSWMELTFEAGPAGRSGAILVGDWRRNRLLLIGGHVAGGTAGEAYALDLTSLTWSSVPLAPTGLGPIEAAAYSHDGAWLYVYGGRNGGTYLDGLYEIELSTLTGRRIDGPAGPGPRAGAALRYAPRSQVVYLFGGLSPQPRSDLWRFDLPRQTWTQLSADSAPDGPAAMAQAAVVPSVRDGAVSVLAGKTAVGASDPSWRFLGGRWRSFRQLLAAGPVALCRNVTLELHALGQAQLAPGDVDAGSYDPAGGAITLSLDRTSFSCADLAAPRAVTLTVTSASGVASCSASVTVEDRIAPTIQSATASPNTLWPPNHRLVLVTVSVSVTDNCTTSPRCLITSVTSNEPLTAPGSGATQPDWEVVGDLAVRLRAERCGTGRGRIYTLAVECADAEANLSRTSVAVIVPHDQGRP